MSKMMSKFGGQVIGDFRVYPHLFETMVSHDGLKFVVHIWADNRAHAIARLAVAAAASFYYEILSCEEVDERDWDGIVGACRTPVA